MASWPDSLESSWWGSSAPTSSEVGDEYERDPWAPLKAEAIQQG